MCSRDHAVRRSRTYPRPASAIAMTKTSACGIVGTGVGADDELHVDGVMLLLSSVTAALRASARPTRFAPVVIVMLVSARMLPAKEVDVPIVADEPTCQYTLHCDPPLVITT